MRYEPRWSDAHVRAIRDVASDIRQIEIVPDEGARAYSPGSHLGVAVMIDELPDVRTYSLVGDRPMDCAYRIAVKREPRGRGGSRYMWSLSPGARLSISDPQNLFELGLGRPEYLLVAGGIGITPILGMALTLARLDARFRLLYAGRCREAMPFLDELHARLGDRLALRISEEGTRLDLAAEIASLHPRGELYLCGPMRLVDSARRAFQASGRPSENLRFETFGSSGKHAPEAFVVKVVDRGVELTVPENRTMLDALRDAGVEMMFDCLRGECGLCAVDVVAVDGEIDHRDVFLSEAQKSEQKKICACVSRVVRGSITVDTGFRPGRR